MARKQDVMITLTMDSNKKRLSKKYNIWFNKDHSATFIDHNEPKMGTLNKEDAKGLKDILMK